MTASTVLAIGTRVRFDGEVWVVTALDGRHVTLERAGHSTAVALPALLRSPGFAVVGVASAPSESIGLLFAEMTKEEHARLVVLEGHIKEVTTGFRSGTGDQALPGEPRAEYLPSLPERTRVSAKAVELGIGPSTLRRHIAAYRNQGMAGLIDRRRQLPAQRFGHIDAGFVAIAARVLDDNIDESQIPNTHLIDRVCKQFKDEHPGKPLPSERSARRVLAELKRNRSADQGTSAKAKRSIAGRPKGTYGHLTALRPGEVVMLDTTPLDVFAMDRLTLQWLPMQLTVAMDLRTRCVTGLRLSPISAKAVDAALVIYETISPWSRSHTSDGILPYGGVPEQFVIVSEDPRPALPGCAIDTIVIDHGKMYMADHIKALCEGLGISIQPARPHQPTDKPALERFFRTLREDLLAGLPGYKGPDVFSRGKDVESHAYYFSDELEAIIREWCATRYHRRPHDGLRMKAAPGLLLTPEQAWEHATSMYGSLRVPARPDLVYDFLPIRWLKIQHYGIDIGDLVYNGDALNGYRSTSSEYASHDFNWPIRYDPEDLRQVFFQRPDDHTWGTLLWQHASEVPIPFSEDAVKYAKRLARAGGRQLDSRTALLALFERWGTIGLTGPVDRRIAIRMSEQAAARLQLPQTANSELMDTAAINAGEQERGPDDDDTDEIDPEDDTDYYRDNFEAAS